MICFQMTENVHNFFVSLVKHISLFRLTISMDRRGDIFQRTVFFSVRSNLSITFKYSAHKEEPPGAAKMCMRTLEFVLRLEEG